MVPPITIQTQTGVVQMFCQFDIKIQYVIIFRSSRGRIGGMIIDKFGRVCQDSTDYKVSDVQRAATT